MKYKILIAIITMINIYVSTDVNAKTYAWLIDLKGKAQKLDVSANSIIQSVDLKGNPSITVSLQDIHQAVVSDQGANLVLFVNDYGRVGQWISAYDLKDMNFRKKIPIESRDPNLRLPMIVMPQGVNKFYIAWWDTAKEVAGKGGETYSAFDKITLNKIADSTTFTLNVYQPLLTSMNINRLYSLAIRKNELKSYDSTSLNLADTISLASFWDMPLFGKGMEYFTNDKLLFSENVKLNKSAPNNFKYFIYDIPTKTLSSKINVDEVGYGVISPDGTKLIIMESSHNKIDIYDVASGNKIKNIDFSSKYSGVSSLAKATISPDSAKLYLICDSVQSASAVLLVVDIKEKFSVIAEIPGVSGTDMIFYEDQ